MLSAMNPDYSFHNPLLTGTPYRGILANSQDPDDNAAVIRVWTVFIYRNKLQGCRHSLRLYAVCNTLVCNETAEVH